MTCAPHIKLIKITVMNNKLMQEIVEKSLISKITLPKPKRTYIDWCDQLCALVSAIPIVGGTFATEIQSIKNSVAEYKTYEFFRKFTRFIYKLEELTEEQRNRFIDDIEKAADDSSGNIIMGLVDRLDNINKEEVLANLVKAKVTNKISIEDFFRLSSILERIPYVDLIKLNQYSDDYYDEDGDSELLFATGALQQSVLDAENGNKYILSKLGKKLLGYGLLIEVPEIQSNSTKISNLEWNDINGIAPISKKEIDNITKQHGKEQAYIDSNQAMLDLDYKKRK